MSGKINWKSSRWHAKNLQNAHNIFKFKGFTVIILPLKKHLLIDHNFGPLLLRSYWLPLILLVSLFANGKRSTSEKFHLLNYITFLIAMQKLLLCNLGENKKGHVWWWKSGSLDISGIPSQTTWLIPLQLLYSTDNFVPLLYTYL